MRWKYRDPQEAQKKFIFIPARCIECGDTIWLEQVWTTVRRDINIYFVCNQCAKIQLQASALFEKHISKLEGIHPPRGGSGVVKVKQSNQE